MNGVPRSMNLAPKEIGTIQLGDDDRGTLEFENTDATAETLVKRGAAPE